MTYLLDTNAVIELLAGNSVLNARLRLCLPREVAISAIVAYELFFGAYKSRKVKENLAQVEALNFEILEFDKEDARQAGEVRAVLATIGNSIGPYDVLIAGQARVRDLILVTHNIKEFSRVDGLMLEDWQT